ncbi:MAG: NAD(+) diphosphatase [Firmicutes bacterium]|nr:NAD(+) diphosphatase [Bacillota bacterium]
MIQDIAPRHLDNQYRPGQKVGPDSWILYFEGNKLAVGGTDGQILFPRWKDLVTEEEPVYLFSVDQEDFFLLRQKTEIPGEFVMETLRGLRSNSRGPRYMIFAANTGIQLAHWYQDNRFCGRCGTLTELATDERAIICPQCGRRIYPRIVPAVIVGVTNGSKLLITRYANRPFVHNALVAGFTEIGETLEQTVAREVREEVGLSVKNIRYYKSQPWGMVDDLLAGFYCDVDGDPAVHLDDGELASAIWTESGEIIGQPDDFSLTNEMMIHFRETGGKV